MFVHVNQSLKNVHASNADSHLLALSLCLGILKRVKARLEELLVRVFLHHVLLLESFLVELVDEVLITRKKVLLGVAGVVDERGILYRCSSKRKESDQQSCT